MSSSPSHRNPRRPCNPSPPAYGALSSTMPIPHAREPVPPPLPPPPRLPQLEAGQDPGWLWGNSPNDTGFTRPATVKPGSSLLLGSWKRGEERDYSLHHPSDVPRKSSSISTVTPGRDFEMRDDDGHSPREDDARLPRISANTELTGERDLRQRTIEQSSHSYDKQLVNRIGGPNTPKRQSLPYIPGGLGVDNGALATLNTGERRKSSAWSISIPERRHMSVDSSSTPRWSFASGNFPPSIGSWPDQSSAEFSRPTTVRVGSFASEGPGSHRESYDYSMFVHDDEEGHMGSLNLHERSPNSPKAGSKRRASSPPREREDRSSLSSASGQNEMFLRNPLQARTSPSSRFHPNHSSLSSTSSAGPRHGSLGSSLSIASIPSSATSYASERISPSIFTPASDFESRNGSLLVGGISPNTKPSGAPFKPPPPESAPRVASTRSPKDTSHSRAGSLSKLPGLYICECCPKKPRKFDTQEELKLHESEKQYSCAYCSNRFKNKNEAERHQNSLHLRRQSWSCAALADAHNAFHASSPPNDTDLCGYCGQEFSNPPHWTQRMEHLRHMHKFDECNLTKKFFRADHFRQHLKHTHHGTAGKWTNLLESACVKEEPLPEKRPSPGLAVSGPPGQAPRASPALMVTTTGLSSGLAPGPLPPETIEETPHDT